jgi:hypothetical protein
MQALGGITCPTHTFATNCTTWTNLSEGGIDDHDRDTLALTQLTSIVTALSSSTRARSAGLYYLDEARILECLALCPNHIRACILTSYPPESLPLRSPNPKEISNSTTPSTNSRLVHLVLIETKEINPFDYLLLQAELRLPATLYGDSPHRPTINLPWKYPSKNYTRSSPRNPFNRHPTLPFLKTSPSIISPHNNPNKLETHHKVAAAVGILPHDLFAQLTLHNHTPDLPPGSSPTSTAQAISALIRSTVTLAYKRRLKWHRIDKYGLDNDRYGDG